jgi:AraC-like DNA-binding protein
MSQFDVLGDVLEALRFRGTIFLRSKLAAPWGMSVDAAEFPRFHIALSGGFYVGAETIGMPIEVREMDIVMLPGGESHWVADRPGRTLVASTQASEACELGTPLFQKGEITNNLMCGLVRFDRQMTHALLNALPNIIHIQDTEHGSPIWRLVELIDSELFRSGKLGGPVVDRLSEVLFMQLLQEFIDRTEMATGFIAALRDRRLSRALGLIHQRPDQDWTIGTLAEQVGMSRSTLVRHFSEVIGVPPIEYLIQWRLLKAHTLVKHSTESLERIAERVGFASAQTLTKAFKRQFGYSPASLRKKKVP